MAGSSQLAKAGYLGLWIRILPRSGGHFGAVGILSNILYRLSNLLSIPPN
jgi:hypothetical protein